MTRRHWREALRAGSTVLDLSGALDQENGVLVRAPWLGSTATADLFTPAIVPAHPGAVAIALLLERASVIGQRCALRRNFAVPVRRRVSLDATQWMSWHQQTVHLLELSGDCLDRCLTRRVAYNLLTGLGENRGCEPD